MCKIEGGRGRRAQAHTETAAAAAAEAMHVEGTGPRWGTGGVWEDGGLFARACVRACEGSGGNGGDVKETGEREGRERKREREREMAYRVSLPLQHRARGGVVRHCGRRRGGRVRGRRVGGVGGRLRALPRRALPWSAQPPRALHLGGVRVGATRASRQVSRDGHGGGVGLQMAEVARGCTEAGVAGAAQPRLGHGSPRLGRSRAAAAASPRRPTAGLARDFATGVVTTDPTVVWGGWACVLRGGGFPARGEACQRTHGRHGHGHGRGCGCAGAVVDASVCDHARVAAAAHTHPVVAACRPRCGSPRLRPPQPNRPPRWRRWGSRLWGRARQQL